MILVMYTKAVHTHECKMQSLNIIILSIYTVLYFETHICISLNLWLIEMSNPCSIQ